MSTYPPARKLTRSRDDRVIAGVCGGLARYLNMDPSVVRILTAVISLFTGVGLIAYIVAAVVVPEDGKETSLWQQNTPFGGRAATDPTDPSDPTAPDGPVYGSATDTPDGADLR